MKLVNYKNKQVYIALSLSLLTPVAYADWGVRLGVNNRLSEYNVKSKEKIQMWLSPQYRGDKFNIGNGISYDLTNSNKHAIELLLKNKNSGFKSNTDKLFKGMSKRKASLDIGARGIVNTGPLGTAVIDVTRDVNASKGFEVGLKLGGISPHAPRGLGERKVIIAAKTGLRYQSAKVTNYYYGVKNTEATVNRKAYKAKSAVTPFVGFDAQANLTRHITLDGSLAVSKRAKSIRNSPLTNNKKYQLGANIGLSYWF